MNEHAIVGGEVRLVRIPVDPPRGDAIQQFDALELPVVDVVDARRRHGVGFGYTIGTGGSAIVELLKKELVNELIGKDARAIRAVGDHLRKHIHALTPGCLSSTALAAVDVALWDLAGIRTGTPLHLLLGGARDRVPLYNTHVGWLNRQLDEMVDLAVEAVRRDGFRALKLKVGKRDPEEDVARLAKVREAVGSSVTLMVDANQSWTANEAVSRVRTLQRFDLFWVEEPVEATDIDGYVRLGALTSVARAGGESLYSPAAFHENIRRGALDLLQPDVARVGGITNAMAVCHLAACANLPVAPHVSPELSVAVAAAVPNSVFVEYIPQMEPLLAERLVRDRGDAIPFDAPGHGIRFDPEALERFTVRDTVMEFSR